MKNPFIAGLVTLLPIAITLFVVLFMIDFITTPFVGLVEAYITKHELTLRKHTFALICISRLVILIGLLGVILILGMLGRKLIFSWFIHFTHRLFYKIPIIKTIYKITREISTRLFHTDQESLFKGTVAVPFPDKHSKALGLLSGFPPEAVNNKKEGLQAVFVPTAPHPVSGFLLLYNRNEIDYTNIETEDLFKILISCGLYHPSPPKNHES